MSDFRSCMIVIKSAFPRQHPRGKPVFLPSWGAQLSYSAPARYSRGETPITSRKALANLLALS